MVFLLSCKKLTVKYWVKSKIYSMKLFFVNKLESCYCLQTYFFKFRFMIFEMVDNFLLSFLIFFNIALAYGIWSCLLGFPEIRDCPASNYYQYLNTECRWIFLCFPDHDIFPKLRQFSIIITFLLLWHWSHGGCCLSAEDAYSSMALDPTSIF